MNVPASFENGYARLPGIGVLSVAGRDAAKFLQGQATCDILGLPPGQTTLGAFCTAKGRALAVFRVLRVEDRVFLLLPSDLLEAVRLHLRKYVLRAEVRIEDASAHWAAFGLFGQQSAAALHALGLPPLDQDNEAEGQGGLLASFYAIRMPDVGGPRVLVLADAAKAEGIGRFWEAQGFARLDEACWHLEDIRAGLPTVTPATAEAFVPQMLNLDLLGGISFNKGCYTGQEIVARTHYLGSLKRRMFRLRGGEGPPPRAGDGLSVGEGEERNAGTVVAAAASPDGGYELLAVLGGDLAETAGSVFKTAGGARLALSDLPYLPAAAG
jgi:hypothetical protein